MGIQTGISIRIAAMGVLIIKVPGADNGPKADALACRMREVLGEREDVRVDRPIKTAEIRVRGLESSIGPEEVKEAAAKKGGSSWGKSDRPVGFKDAPGFASSSLWPKRSAPMAFLG